MSMAIFKFANCKRLPAGKPPFSYGFSYGFPMVFPWNPCKKPTNLTITPRPTKNLPPKGPLCFARHASSVAHRRPAAGRVIFPLGDRHLKMWRNTIQLAMSTGEKMESMMINYGILGCKTRNCRTYPSFLGDWWNMIGFKWFQYSSMFKACKLNKKSTVWTWT